MVYCVQAELAFATTARRSSARTAITTARTGRVTWGPSTLLNAVLAIGANGLVVEDRFVLAADRDLYYTQVVTEAQTRPALAGSVVSKHDCTHDERDPRPCVISEQTVI